MPANATSYLVARPGGETLAILVIVLGSALYLLAPVPPSGIDKIEFLQNHENVEIYRLAFKIIEKYFHDEVSRVIVEVALRYRYIFCVHKMFGEDVE